MPFKNRGGTASAVDTTNDAARVIQAALPADFHTQITPTIAGSSARNVSINSGAAAGSKHLDDTTPTVAETLAEQIIWDFSSLDDVRQVEVTLDVLNPFVTALSATTAAVIQAPEASKLRVTINPGDDVTAANRLRNGYPEVVDVLPGEKLTISSSVAITKVYAIAVLNPAVVAGTVTALANSAVASCIGANYA